MKNKVVYCYAVLDIMHRGHLEFLWKAKEIAGKNGKLIVGILTNNAVMEKKPKPIMDFLERLQITNSLKMIDKVVEQKTYSPINNVISIKPDILNESTSHTGEAISEAKDVMKKLGGKVIVLSYFKEQSSSKIKENIKNEKK